jgi:hypothetical protein
MTGPPGSSARPADVCRGLLAVLEGSEGRRRQRKRDTRPDAIGLGLKRDILQRAIEDDPDPDGFEGWLLDQCMAAHGGAGGVRAMAMEIFAEWRLARASGDFRQWLDAGAPSDDRALAP